MGFWAGALTVLVMVFALAVVLYAVGMWRATSDVPFWETLRDVAKQWLSGDFWK